MKRWQLLSAGLVLSAAALAVAQSSRSTTLVYGGDFSDLITLDPGQSYEFSGGLITDNLYETLVKFEGEDLSKLKSGLAASWSVLRSGENWKIKFLLRTAKFSSGNPVTADDVVYSFDRAIALNGNGAFLFTDIANMKVGSTKALDPKTVEVTLPKTASPQSFLNLLTFNIGGIVDSVEVKKRAVNNDYGTAWLKTNSAGSGAFVLNRWDQGQQVALDANPNSRLKSKLRRVILRNITESNAQRIALESGEIDIAENLSPEMVKTKQKDSNFVVYKADSLRLQYLGMNSGADSPFADTRVRQAVRYALDQDGIVNDLLGGFGRKMQTIIPAGLFGANLATPYSQNLEKARDLLKAAGKASIEAEFLVPTGTCGGGVSCGDLAAKIQSDLGKVGIKLNLKQIVQSELLKIYRAQKAEMVLVGWSPDFPDPDGNGTPLGDFNAKSLAWRNVWNNATASRLAQQAALESNATRRAALYKQLTELVLNEGPYAILYQPSVPVSFNKGVKGYLRNAQGQVRFETISK